MYHVATNLTVDCMKSYVIDRMDIVFSRWVENSLAVASCIESGAQRKTLFDRVGWRRFAVLVVIDPARTAKIFVASAPEWRRTDFRRSFGGIPGDIARNAGGAAGAAPISKGA